MLRHRIQIVSALVLVIIPPAYVTEYAMRLSEFPCWWIVSDFAWFLVGMLVVRHTSREACEEIVEYDGGGILSLVKADTNRVNVGSLAETPEKEIPVMDLTPKGAQYVRDASNNKRLP